MTTEEVLRKELEKRDALLDDLMAYFRSNNVGDNIDQDELDSINNSIEEYQISIEKLREKVNNEEYYKRKAVDLEFDLGVQGNSFVEILQSERENMSVSNKHYHKRQAELTKLSAKYNDKIKGLKEEIDNISRVLKRDELAKEKNIVKKSFLSEKEIFTLKEEIEYKQDLLSSFGYLIDYCADEIRRYGKLITTCEQNLKEFDDVMITAKKIIESEIKYPEQDTYRLLLDKEELRKIENAYKALLNRKNAITYNPVEAIESVRKNEEQISSEVNSDEQTVQPEEQKFSEEEMRRVIDELLKSQQNIPEDENIENKTDEYLNSDKENMDNSFENELSYEEKASNFDLSEQEVAETENNKKTSYSFTKGEMDSVSVAPEHLKQEKLSSNFQAKWKKWADTEKTLESKKEEISYSDIPEVEVSKQDEESLHEVILTSAGDYVGVPLPNGEMGYVDYGDSVESAPEGVNIRYEGSKMYITYPERRKTR